MTAPPASRSSRASTIVGVAVCATAAFLTSAVFETPRYAVAAGNIYAIEPQHVEESRAYKYARLDDDACFSSLDARAFPYKKVDATKGVAAPVRLSGPVHGVTFKLTYRGPENTDDDRSPSSIFDCRLGLAIDDLAVVLEKHDVVQAEYLSMYRAQGLGFAPPGVRHPSGRAIDLATVTRKDGTTFNVTYDFHGRGVGAKTCGEKAALPTKDTEGARLLRDIVCELGDQQSFNLILTPHYDWGHRDHFHMEVRSDIRWYLIQ
jgi:hypothetical protein